MKIKIQVLLLGLASMVAACRAQIPITHHVVSLTWQVPQPSGSWTGCTAQSPCSYVVSRASIPSGITACPSTSGTNYTPLNQSAPASGTGYIDTSASGLNVCYIVQTLQGQATSSPSTTAQLTVPADPLAPSLGPPTTAVNTPEGPVPPIFAEMNSPVRLSARVVSY